MAILLLFLLQDGISFTDRTREAGLLEPLEGILGHGAAWGDLDGDGDLDLYVGGFCDRPGKPVPNRLFRNAGGRFETVDQASMKARTSGALFVDLDGDGFPELYVANNALPRPKQDAQARGCALFRNDKGTLVDISDSGACPKDLFTARNIGAFDFDGDGLLDLFVVEDKLRRGGAARSRLLRNLGGLKFVEADLPEDIHGLGLAVADLNGDNRPDFFVPHANKLFLSGNAKYVAHAPDVFAWKPMDGEDWPCGAAFGDLNRDGRLDLVLSIHHAPARNRVFFNEGLKDGKPVFRDVTKEVGLADPVPVKCPHVEIQDFDNDGWPDIYMSAAWKDGDAIVPLVYRNEGGRFMPPRPIQEPMVYFPAGPSADYDGDGRVDLFLVNWFEGNHCRLLRNESPKRHWLDVKAKIGTKVRVTNGGVLLGCQEVSVGYGYASGQAPVCHFGLGDETRVDVELTFPSGKTIKKEGVEADQVLDVREP